MKIGDLSRALGVPVETIRYYERARLLPAPDRTASNYRAYGPGHTDRLRFIVNCRALDMSLDEIRALLRYHDAPTRDCGNVSRLLDEHIEHIASRMSELARLQRQLRALRKTCGHERGDGSCGILLSLREPRAGTRRRPLRHSHARRAH